MRFTRLLAAGALLAVPCVTASEETVPYQSDIARLLRVVVSHLYHHRDVFLRELISNAGDALEKLRFQSLTDPSVLDAAPALNITLRAYDNPSRLVISDSGIGMTRDELQKNLGTIARSGTSDFVSQIEGSSGGGGGGSSNATSSNLIGQFGLGFYSSFLVADRVTVASKSNADSTQWVFESAADAQSFTIREDERGATLGRGTEITLYLKPDCTEYTESGRLRALIGTHSEFATTSPIYLWVDTTTNEEIREGDADYVAPPEVDAPEPVDGEEPLPLPPTEPQTREVTRSDWERVNDQQPLWMRDPKEVSEDEYKSFYRALAKDQEDPLFWSHFRGEAGRTSFRALIYMPSTISNDFYNKPYTDFRTIRMFVRRVFITSDLGEDFIPKWLNYLKIIVDADDLPLNVGRDSLQSSRDLVRIKANLVKKALDMMTNVAKNDPETYAKFIVKANTPLKLGVHEDAKSKPRLIKLLRFVTSHDVEAAVPNVSLDDYVSRRKRGQKQIYFIASSGAAVADLARSPFVETVLARGYEVLYLTEPMDELIVAAIGTYDTLKFQDVAKKGLLFGDEDEHAEENRATEAAAKERFEPLMAYLKKELEEGVSSVVLSTRLTTSPCAVVADSYAWTGNMERLMAAQNTRPSANGQQDFMTNFMRAAKREFEINPRHPLIEGLADRLADEGEDDESLRDTVRVLWDTALVRSGFNLKDTNSYFDRVEQLLRRSIGVSSGAKMVEEAVKPAPPVESGPLPEASADVDEDADDNSAVRPNMADQGEWQDWSKLKQKIERDGPEKVRDEL